MRLLLAAVCFVCLAIFAEESPSKDPASSVPKDPLKGKPLAHWIERLGSESFDEREEATQTLAEAGDNAIPDLKKALESGDNEVRVRAKTVLAGLLPISIEGEFLRVGSESFSQGGRRTTQNNEAGESTLSIKRGEVTFKQDYSKGITQVYSFPLRTPVQFRSKCEIELNWESINTNSGYNPDSSDAKLECTNTAEGLRIIFSARDTAGTSFKMTYVPKEKAK